MKHRYWVVYEWSGQNFSGYAPDVPGCMATAPTLEAMRTTLEEALEAHLQWLSDAGDPIPEPSAAITVDTAEDPEFPNPPGYYVVVDALHPRFPADRPGSRELAAA